MRSGITLLFIVFTLFACRQKHPPAGQVSSRGDKDSIPVISYDPSPRVIDTVLYRQKLSELAVGKPAGKWPVVEPYPLPGAVVPYKRVVAFYGNLYSKNMGILGSLPPGKMLVKLQEQVEEWSKADSLTEVQPALHYIAVTAQSKPGKDGKYRLRMPAEQIDKVLQLAKKANALVFLDIQVGQSSLESEIPQLEPYLKMEQVHLGIDPEYAMKKGQVPGTVIGTFDAADINFASGYLASLVQKYNLPPKMLVVHRFTGGMVTNYKKILLHPELQLIINMDGFGSPAKKRDSYHWIRQEPVQFAGFKLFYNEDKPVMKPTEVLKLYPRPIYIQYQ